MRRVVSAAFRIVSPPRVCVELGHGRVVRLTASQAPSLGVRDCGTRRVSRPIMS